ncbi:6,7,8-trihydroxycoumarin synthase isoform X1 [Daucus carota subsp. sativus]|nr:PREDICTED: cytochrome P450 83B1-like isoform X1 [Daucus carota subsp. sativus]XP_017227479.1 PREDICTED: cytochrome P450 83B1-like isoform X2 [Daucus carota subsp. sativus]
MCILPRQLFFEVLHMDLLVIVLVIAFPLAFLYLSLKHIKKDDLPSPPGPPGLPLIGNMHQLYKASSNHEHFWQLSKKYGSLVTLHLGSVPALVVSSSKMAKQVLKTQDAIYSSKPAMTGQQKMSYNGLEMAFSPYSEHWRDVRKFCTLELFTQKRAQMSVRPVREEEVYRMIDGLAEAASASKEVDVHRCFSDFASSIITRVAFGKRYDQGGKFHRVLSEIEALYSNFFVSDYFPMFGWIDKLTGMMARLDRTFVELDMFYQELIDEHLKPDRLASTTDDVIDVLLRNKSSASFALTMNHVKAILMDIIVAGTGTTATVLTWVMTALMRNPGVMKKVQEEVRRVIGKKGKIDEDDLQNLPYLRAVVKETMRLYPPGPLLLPRETMGSSVIGEDKDHMYKIKPKTLVFVSMWAIGRDPEDWKEPLEFIPERFLERPDIDYKGQHFEYIPFGAGRRQCPGLNLGAMNVELALANVLYTFDWELPDGLRSQDVDEETVNGLTLQRKNVLYIRPKIYVCP